MHVTSQGAAREIQEGIAVDPLLVGCGVKLTTLLAGKALKLCTHDNTGEIKTIFDSLLLNRAKGVDIMEGKL